MDVTEFAVGRQEATKRNKRLSRLADFQGRPKFANEIADLFRISQPHKEASRDSQSAFRTLFRALDAHDWGREVQSVGDLKDAHGWLLKEYIRQSTNKKAYSNIRTIIDRLREISGFKPLIWPTPDAKLVNVQDDVDVLGVQRLYNAIKGHARDIKSMFAEGERLAVVGEDPRLSAERCGNDKLQTWSIRANHAWLVRELTSERLCTNDEIIRAGAAKLKFNGYDPRSYISGPAYLAPAMSKRGSHGVVGKLRWFHPSLNDTAVLFWLFLIGTGWNLSTALALDISKDENWVRSHPHKPEFKVLYSFKSRAGRHVFTLSLEKPEWHPYQIVRFMIERTAVLRSTLQQRLIDLEQSYARMPNLTAKAEIDRLQKAIRSPWLYHSLAATGSVGALTNDHSGLLNNVVRVILSEGLIIKHPSLASFVVSVARDAWIGRTYAMTSHSVLLAQLAAQHTNLKSLHHYLKRRRFRHHSEKVIRRIQDAAFAEIVTRRQIDPTRLRMLVGLGSITSEQEKRLLDYRQRTRLGMGCLQPEDPPRYIEPDHEPGNICRVQRCTGCHHGVVFASSLVPLARARAELLHLQREIPLASWEGSSFQDELQSIVCTLENFDQSLVEAETTAWLAKLHEEEISPHDTYPQY
ncbi:hypothetical protein [Methylobacterium radiotolerans]|uniref:hypothetical protein n=1 Tax=Methylobacterium radiotolerans TaxID=31998 RepID=UPI0038D0FDA5